MPGSAVRTGSREGTFLRSSDLGILYRPGRDRRASVCHVLPGVPHQSHAHIIDHQFELISIYRGAFGLKGYFRGLWCTNGSRKPISSRLIPERSAAPDAPAPWPASALSCTRRCDAACVRA